VYDAGGSLADRETFIQNVTMRIVHTSDWHAGRIWRRIDRLPELADVLENLGDFLESERVDLLLMSGDVFDSGAPNPAAERLVFGFFKRIGRAGIQTVVIAGNHDSPARLQAWGTLAELVNVRAVAFPYRRDAGGLLELVSRSGEKARVAIRNIRRDAIHAFKEMIKDKSITQDEEHRSEEKIQKMTDAHIASVDKTLEAKEKEIMEV